MNGWLSELRVSFRSLRKAPQVALIAIFAIALSIGATSTVFSVVNGVLIRPLPFPDAQRLVAIWARDPAVPDSWLSATQGEVRDWQERSRSFEALVAGRNRSFTLTSFEDGDTPLMREISHGYFELLGMAPLHGRLFTPDEDKAGGPRVVLLSYELWQRRFGGDRAAVGRATELDGRPFEIVGVMPPGTDNPVFATAVRPQAWLPLALPPSGLDRRNPGHVVLARLAPGVSLEQARQDLASVSRGIREEHPEERRDALVVPAAERIVRDVRPAVLLLFGAVLLVLLVACGNVANLLLTRALERRREIALRKALGAGLGQLARQLVTEGLVLSLIGSGLGLFLAFWGTAALPWLLPSGATGAAFQFAVDERVVGFTFALAFLTGLVFGLVPVLHALERDVSGALGSGAIRSTADRRRQALRNGLVVGEVALSLVLLIGAGLMLQSFARLQALDPGFDPRNLLTFRLSTRGADYREASQRAAFFDEMARRLHQAPGIVAAGAVRFMPLFTAFGQVPVSADAEPVEPGSELRATPLSTSPRFFETMRMPLLRGRGFDERDSASSPAVAVLSRTLARRLFGKRDPVGQRLTVGGPEPTSREIVGVVGDVRSDQTPPDPGAIVYVPVAQDGASSAVGFAVRTRGEPYAALAEVEKQVRAVDRALPVYTVQSMEDLLGDIDGSQRALRSLLAVFAALALGLAMTGIYAVLSYNVSRRKREIGIRVALGAARRDVLAMILRGACGLALAGIALGLGLSYALSGVLRSQLYGIAADDMSTYASLATALAAVVLAASAAPALRATRVDPAITLREE